MCPRTWKLTGGIAAALIGAAAATWAVRSLGGAAAPDPPFVNVQEISDPQLAAFIAQAIAEAKRSPRDSGLRRQLGEILLANSFDSAAQEAFEQAAAMNPDDARTWYFLALCRAGTGDLPAAIQAIAQAAMLEKQYAPIHWRRGLWLMDLQRIDEAQEAFEQAIRIDRDDPGGTIGLARVALQRGDPDQAIRVCNEWLARQPRHALVRQLLSRAYRAKGMEQRADAEEAKAVPGSLSWRDPWRVEIDRFRRGYKTAVERAQQLIDAQRPAEAASLLEEIRPSYPNDLPLSITLCAAYMQSLQVDRALRLMREAEQKHPNHFAVHLNLAHLLAAQQDFKQALAHADRAVELNPTLAAAHLTRGEILLRAGDADRAASAIEASIRHGGSTLQALQLLGDVQRAAGRLDASLGTYAQAAEAFPRESAPWVGMASAFGMKGDLTEAENALRNAQRINPNDPGITQVRDWLIRLRTTGGRTR